MDRSVYIAMTGATQTMRAQDAVSHNLANASTVGFKSELSAFQSVPVLGPGANTRINAVAQGVGQDDTQGTIQRTGRSLDVAVNGPGWIAVQAPDGTEAYTRAGDLQLGPDGSLTDSRGNPVMGSGGPITIPDAAKISIGADGTISTVPMGQGPDTVAAVGQIKLVNPDPTQMSEGADGLMHMNDGSTADTDSTVTVTSGALEASNVNPSSELVKMISLSRQYEMQVRSIKTAEDDADDSTKLLQSS
ncbi:flagellar basal-body rod protein FlgF [Dyella nitratireducens]|uniref:Flagellar basal-body rod protein FlgF n=1 Tax=Dyella nitratireducens TaxID=1849580 RepID=A0ABQ1FSK1_9GAMM|nr:flagellar basal-body rod protein FlgF [Dyella nitratireducens]GGA27770.1 flagellar basal-body rod protein FlgF [Dyella nitratireducens]GLQ43369.1 flagellar basal-body rod protein FlgF [Dyella nitratireducens]